MLRRNRSIIIVSACYLCLAVIFMPLSSALAAGDKLAMTIAPPLIKNNLSPGENWVSQIKVVNNNSEEMTVYTQVSDFKSGPEGEVVFLEINNASGTGEYLLSSWIEVEPGPIIIGPNQSRDIPFAISVPANAGPGGHYAAILVGNRPNGEVEGTGFHVSSMLATLLLVTVKGDIQESGDINEFYAEKEYYDHPEANFHLSFRNTGNVHLQPKGEIVITDMWGKDKGKIEVSQGNDFGNVLPNSIKKWTYSWDGEDKLTAMGRYRAELALHYGEQAKETASRSTYFWVIDFKVVGSILGSILFLILSVYWLVRFSIRRAIKNAQKSILPQQVVVPTKIADAPVEKAMAKTRITIEEEQPAVKAKPASKIVDLRAKK